MSCRNIPDVHVSRLHGRSRRSDALDEQDNRTRTREGEDLSRKKKKPGYFLSWFGKDSKGKTKSPQTIEPAEEDPTAKHNAKDEQILSYLRDCYVEQKRLASFENPKKTKNIIPKANANVLDVDSRTTITTSSESILFMAAFNENGLPKTAEEKCHDVHRAIERNFGKNDTIVLLEEQLMLKNRDSTDVEDRMRVAIANHRMPELKKGFRCNCKVCEFDLMKLKLNRAFLEYYILKLYQLLQRAKNVIGCVRGRTKKEEDPLMEDIQNMRTKILDNTYLQESELQPFVICVSFLHHAVSIIGSEMAGKSLTRARTQFEDILTSTPEVCQKYGLLFVNKD